MSLDYSWETKTAGQSFWQWKRERKKKERNLFTPTKRYNKLNCYWIEWMLLYQEDAKQESSGQGT